MERQESYVLATGDEATRRLDLISVAHGPHTEAFLQRVGIQTGMRVADIGCGSGTVSCWIARQVGPNGLVVGVDANVSQVELCRKNAAAAGRTNTTFVRAIATDTGLDREAFDLVYCRLLLIHLPQPDDALQEMRAPIKPGGILACEEFEADTCFSEPTTAAAERFAALMVGLAERLGLDWCLGRSLYRRFLAAGFPNPEVFLAQAVHTRPEARRIPELTLAEMIPALVSQRLITPEECDQLKAGFRAIAADTTILIGSPRMTQIWARKPN